METMLIYGVWIKTHMSGRWVDSFWLTEELAFKRVMQIREAQVAGGCNNNSTVNFHVHELVGASLDQPQEKEVPFE